VSFTTTAQSDPIAGKLTTVTTVAVVDGPPAEDENVTGASGIWYQVDIDNSSNSEATYVKLWNAASVTLGSTVPDWIFLVRAGTRRTFSNTSGGTFGAALSVCAVTEGGTTGTTSMAGDVVTRILST